MADTMGNIESSAMSGKKIPTTVFDPFDVDGFKGTNYPAQFADSTRDRYKRRLGNHGGITNFGVNMVTLPPGAVSALRHHHSLQDEFVYIVSGTPTLITDAGSRIMTAGMCATFPAGNGDGHMLRNDEQEDIIYLEVGDRTRDDTVIYPDDNLLDTFVDGVFTFTNREGVPYQH